MASNLTKQAITASFIKLLNETPLDKLTVKQISEDCGINRNTFYYHYQDIFALLAEIFNDEAERIIEKYWDNLDWKGALIEGTGFAIENKRAIQHVFSSAYRSYFDRYLDKVVGEIMHQFVLRQAEGLKVKDSDMELVEKFYMHAFIGTVREWVENGMDTDVLESIRRLGEIFEGDIRSKLLKLDSEN